MHLVGPTCWSAELAAPQRVPTWFRVAMRVQRWRSRLSLHLPRSADFSPQEPWSAQGRPRGLKPALRHGSGCQLASAIEVLAFHASGRADLLVGRTGGDAAPPYQFSDSAFRGWRAFQFTANRGGCTAQPRGAPLAVRHRGETIHGIRLRSRLPSRLRCGLGRRSVSLVV
jgi:hypothetical protein